MGGFGPTPVYVLRVGKYAKLANTRPDTKGDNVLIELPLEVDLEALTNRFDMSGRLNIIDWSNTGFSL